MEGPGCQGVAVKDRVREIELKEGPPHPRAPGPAEEKPQCQGGAVMRPVSVADPETGTLPYKEAVSIIIEGGDSGNSALYTSPSIPPPPPMPDTPLSLPQPGDQDSPGPEPGAVNGTRPEGQRGDGNMGGRRHSCHGLHQETEKSGEDAESGGEMLPGRVSPDRREDPKEGSEAEGKGMGLLLSCYGDRRGSGGLHQDIERGGEDAEIGGEMLLGSESPDRREALEEGAGTEGQEEEGLLPGYGDRRGSWGLHQDIERGGEDAESGGEMLLWRESPDRREALKEGSGTEQTSLIPRTGPEGSTQTPPGEEESRKRTLLPPTVTVSSRVLLCAVCGLLLLLVVTLAALTGHYSSQNIPVPPCLESCPMDWLYSRNRCYYLSVPYRKEGAWEESQRFCSSYNGSLALFNTQEELNFLMDVSCQHHVWVGLRRRQEGIHWANGTACSSSLCTITDFGECAYIGSGALRVSGCHLPRPYICTKRPYD